MARTTRPEAAGAAVDRRDADEGVATGKSLALRPGAGSLGLSPTLAINEAIAARRAARQDVLHLGFGEASFPLHPALRAALSRGATSTSYTPVLGVPALRAAIAGYLQRTRGLAMEAEHIAVAPGSKPLLYALLQVLDGDVLLPSPSWVSYAPQARLAGKRVYVIRTDPGDHHMLTASALQDALERGRHAGAEPRILVVNTPSNPTGGMFAEEPVQALADWAREARITLVSDEIYAELEHGWRRHVSPSRLYPEGTIVTGGLSKAFSAGGWRLGYAAVPATEAGRQVIGALRALGSEIWSAASGPIQAAAVAAYSLDAELEAYVRRSARVHGHAAGRLHRTLTALGVVCPRPAGAFYLYPDFAPWQGALARRGITTSEALAAHLLETWGIATLPSTAFGEEPQALRLRLATSMLYTAGSDEETRESSLWELLRHADTVLEGDPASGEPLPLPELERAERRFADFVETLGVPDVE
jgi:aspartate/methionine/tyrosine aminotransferase